MCGYVHRTRYSAFGFSIPCRILKLNTMGFCTEAHTAIAYVSQTCSKCIEMVLFIINIMLVVVLCMLFAKHSQSHMCARGSSRIILNRPSFLDIEKKAHIFTASTIVLLNLIELNAIDTSLRQVLVSFCFSFFLSLSQPQRKRWNGAWIQTNRKKNTGKSYACVFVRSFFFFLANEMRVWKHTVAHSDTHTSDDRQTL